MNHPCADTLRARVEAIPAMLRAWLPTALPRVPDALLRADPWVVTGVGASEGPARVLASELRRAGRRAEFTPLSTFAPGRWSARDVDPRSALVVVSQGLSPNATLALNARSAYAASALVTAAREVPDVTLALRHPPDDEGGLLLRVQGPVAATLCALRLVESLAPGSTTLTRGVIEAIPDAYARALDEGDGVEPVRGEHLALITTRGGYDLAHGLRWEWLEGPGGVDPPVWDVLQFAHGPFQLVADERATLVALEHADDPGGSALVDRLSELLDPSRHRLLRFRASLPGAAGFFEHDARWSRLVTATLAARPRDLVDWPGRGRDHALYDLGR